MKISITQEKLSRGLQIIYRAIPNKSTLPILTNVLIEAKDNSLVLSATNLETAIRTTVPASIEEEGTLAVPAKLLKEFITSLPAVNLKIETKDESFIVKSDKTKTKFSGINSADYPQLPKVPTDQAYIEIPQKELEKITQVVSFSAGTDTSRPVFTGIYLNYKEGVLTAAATDGFRLSETTLKLNATLETLNTIVPAKTLSEISKIFSGNEEPIKIYLNTNDNLLLFSSEDTMVATRILGGQYPDYKRIIPKDKILTATFATEEFSEAVKITNIFAKEANNNTLKLEFDPEEHKIKVRSLAETTGENESTVDSNIEGEYLQMAFNSKYLVDYLNNVKSNTVTLSANGAVAPCLVVTPEHPNLIHIIMTLQA